MNTQIKMIVIILQRRNFVFNIMINVKPKVMVANFLQEMLLHVQHINKHAKIIQILIIVREKVVLLLHLLMQI